jgi:Transglycosylase SLT domain
LKRYSTAAVLIAAAALILCIDAVIVVVPRTLADPAASATPAAFGSPVAAAQPSPTGFWFADPMYGPASTENVYIPGPTPAATPTPSPTPTPKPTPKPTPRDTVWNARAYVKARVGAKGYNCVNAIWTGESKWNPRAGTPSGAYGIPQAYPGNKMAAFGSNWRTSPLTQVKWGLWYIESRYGSACGAYAFWSAHGWY